MTEKEFVRKWGKTKRATSPDRWQVEADRGECFSDLNDLIRQKLIEYEARSRCVYYASKLVDKYLKPKR
jgi:hypothetical protein